MKNDFLSFLARTLRRWLAALPALLKTRGYVGLHLSRVPQGSLVLLPCSPATLCCGVAGIVAFKPENKPSDPALEIGRAHV